MMITLQLLQDQAVPPDCRLTPPLLKGPKVVRLMPRADNGWRNFSSRSMAQTLLPAG